MYLMFLLAINTAGRYSRCLMSVPWRCLCMVSVDWLHAPLPGLADYLPRPGLGGGINTVLPLVPQIGMMYRSSPSLRTPAIWRVRRL